MANISDCWGKLYFNKDGNDKETVAKFIKELNGITSGDDWGDYPLEFMIDNYRPVSVKNIDEDDDYFFIEFFGSGRQSFNSHLGWVFGQSGYGYTIDKEIEKLYKKPEYNGIEFTLEYCDYETGNWFMTLGQRFDFKIDNEAENGVKTTDNHGYFYDGGIDIGVYADYRGITLEEAFVEFRGEPETNDDFELFLGYTGREFQPKVDMEYKHKYYYRGYFIEGRRFWISPTVWGINENGEFVDYEYDDDNNGQYDYKLDRWVITCDYDNEIYIELSTNDYTFEEVKEHIRLGDIDVQLQCEQYYNCQKIKS